VLRNGKWIDVDARELVPGGSKCQPKNDPLRQPNFDPPCELKRTITNDNKSKWLLWEEMSRRERSNLKLLPSQISMYCD
jgi:hypothetical protein